MLAGRRPRDERRQISSESCGAFFARRPFGESVGNVVRLNWCAFVVEGETVSGEIVKPDGFCRRAFFKNERGSADSASAIATRPSIIP